MISAAPANPDLANPDLALPRPAARALRLSSENNELAPGLVPARFALPASPCQLHPASFTGAASPGQRQRKRTRAAPSDRSPSRWQRAWSPLSTGCPGPFQAQPPVQPDERRSPLRCHAEPRGRLDASALHHDVTPNLTSLPVRLASPGAGLSSNLPLIPAMSTVNRVATLLTVIIRLHFL